MNRREFLSAAGAFLAPAAAFAPARLLGQPNCLPPSAPFIWVPGQPSPTDQPNPNAPGLSLPIPFQEFPPKDEKPAIPFTPLGGTPVRRLLWSDLLKDSEAGEKWANCLRKGYTEMLRRSSVNPCDPTGLLYQTWLHGFYCSGVPLGKSNVVDCNGAPQSTDVHNTWDFLPWHRAFLYFHELILADASGCPDFRLPVWDWDNNAATPPVYSRLGLPSYLTGAYWRVANIEPSDARPYFSACALQAWLLSNGFDGFCGTAAKTPQSFWGPHDAVHTFLIRGAMGQPSTAAADPVFYAHHANVDRYWSYWLSHYKDLVDIPDEWKCRQYYFYDEKKCLRSVQAGQLLVDSNFGYDYDLGNLQQSNELYAFDTLAASFTEQTLFERLKARLVGTLITKGITDPVAIGALLTTLSSQAIEGAQELPGALKEHTDSLMIPFVINAQVNSGQIKVGQYYLVRIKNVGAGSLTKPIGGFGIFSHMHQNTQNLEVAITGCIDPDIVGFIKRGNGHIVIEYGVPDEHAVDFAMGKKPTPLLNAMVTFITPKDAYDKGKNWLASWTLPGIKLP